MSNSTDPIIRRFAALFVEQQTMLRDLARNDLLFIVACQSGVSPRALAAAAEAVRESLYSLDALTDKARAISDEIQR